MTSRKIRVDLEVVKPKKIFQNDPIKLSLENDLKFIYIKSKTTQIQPSVQAFSLNFLKSVAMLIFFGAFFSLSSIV